jgi:hypothetical protein
MPFDLKGPVPGHRKKERQKVVDVLLTIETVEKGKNRMPILLYILDLLCINYNEKLF